MRIDRQPGIGKDFWSTDFSLCSVLCTVLCKGARTEVHVTKDLYAEDPDRDLVFRASTRFVVGHFFVGTKQRRRNLFAIFRKMLRDGFQRGFVKSVAYHAHRRVGVDQKNRGNIRQSVAVGNRIAGFVKEHRKRAAVIFREPFGIPRVILRDAQKSDAVSAVSFVNPFEERKRKLAHGTGDFKKRRDRRSAFHRRSQRNFFALERLQRKVGSKAPHGNVGHGFTRSK